MQLDLLLAREDTRVTARRWLETYVPPPGPIMSRESKALRWGRPALEDRYEVVAYGNRLARRRAAPWALLAESPTGYIPWAPEIDAILREVGTVVDGVRPLWPRRPSRVRPARRVLRARGRVRGGEGPRAAHHDLPAGAGAALNLIGCGRRIGLTNSRRHPCATAPPPP